MILHILNTGSKGNGYILQAQDECLIIDAGASYTDACYHLGVKPKNLRGVLLSHAHNDHTAFALDYMKRGIDTYALQETITDLKLRNKQTSAFYFAHPIRYKERFKVGGYQIYPLPMVHDCPCAGYLIYHEEMGTMLFATDTEYIPQVVPNVNHLVIECNYTDSLLDYNMQNGITPQGLRGRLLHTHMEQRTTEKAIEAHKGEKLQNVVLIHASGNNLDKKSAIIAARQIAGVPTYLAKMADEIQLTKWQPRKDT